MFYTHPWEFDPYHPVVDIERKAKFTHYTRLKKTLPFADRLLGEFKFDTVSNVVKQYKERGSVNEYSVEILKA